MSSASLRHLSLTLAGENKTVNGFTLMQWRIAHFAPGEQGPYVLDLQLYMTERTAYRFNLNSSSPRLFVRCGFTGRAPVPDAITASQDVAAAWMDGEQQVLETPMPMALQVWIEAYLAHHGEGPDPGRKKKRKGAGRAREDQP
ncbi:MULTISPECIES: DUF3305 domain-containing protein [Halomonadaceae]|uniref:DUF3305 domain-containing protein n=1 Tax=Halomonadaceae TaxID=28256 RepID=UPI001599658E|nr:MULTISPECIES: DUF3305 domain-containing protein [Halomonas]QJQ96620.1 DUF3305 domain-containing protein [Halomonas sp. PA5]